MACRLGGRAVVNRATARRVSPLRADIPHACALRLLDARMGVRSDVANLDSYCAFRQVGQVLDAPHRSARLVTYGIC